MWFIRRFLVIQIMWNFCLNCCLSASSEIVTVLFLINRKLFPFGYNFGNAIFAYGYIESFFKSAASFLWGKTLDINSMTNLRYCRVRHDVVTAEKVLVFNHPHIASNFHPNLNYFTPNFKLKIWLQNDVKFFVLTRLF